METYTGLILDFTRHKESCIFSEISHLSTTYKLHSLVFHIGRNICTLNAFLTITVGSVHET